jgi:hypothetical protein
MVATEAMATQLNDMGEPTTKNVAITKILYSLPID